VDTAEQGHVSPPVGEQEKRYKFCINKTSEAFIKTFRKLILKGLDATSR